MFQSKDIPFEPEWRLLAVTLFPSDAFWRFEVLVCK